MRAPNSATDFVLTVEGVGSFTFAKKTLRDQMAIEAEYSRLTEGVLNVTNFLYNVASAMSETKVLLVAAPPDQGWENIDEMDPEDSDTYLRLMKVWGALRDKRATFRAGRGKDGEGNRPDAGD